MNAAALLDSIKAGDRVTILVANGINARTGMTEWKSKTGRAVMRGRFPHTWVLNMGGTHGTPGIAMETNIVSVKRIK